MPRPDYETHADVPNFPNANCKGQPVNLFFGPEHTEKDHARKVRIAQAKQICAPCQHKPDCLEWGIRNPVGGIAGGTTVTERNRIRRQRQAGAA